MPTTLERPEGAPPDWEEMSLFEQLAVMPDDELDTILADLVANGLDFGDPKVVLRPKQLHVVESEAWVTVFSGGRGAGKTRVGSAWVNERARENPGCRIALLGRTVADVRDVMVNGESGIIETAPADFIPNYTPSLRKLEWPNGSTAYTYSGDQPSQLRGPQHHYLWADELAAFRHVPDSSGATAWDNAVLSTRLGKRPQLLVTTTPKRVSTMQDLFRQGDDPKADVDVYTASIMSNRANLSPAYIQSVRDKYAGTHLEAQELDGLLVGDAHGALWRSSDIRIEVPPKDTKLIKLISVDPSVGVAGGDDTGIVVVGGTTDPDPFKRKAYVLEDLTFNGSVDEWAEVVIEAQKKHSTEEDPAIIVVEGNQGDQLLRLVLHQKMPSLPIAIVKAKVDKASRAEPVVFAYRQKRVWHTKEFVELNEELTGWEPEISKWSPGHLDALVWGVHTLLIDPTPLYPFAPVLILGSGKEHSLSSAVPAHRRDRTRIGLAAAPWRRGSR